MTKNYQNLLDILSVSCYNKNMNAVQSLRPSGGIAFFCVGGFEVHIVYFGSGLINT